ncbi:SDR family NAD(P)-dependent oxidoreductase [Rhodococcus sp. IEGM 1409]|uniref:SDR family oxidoreductase n=1 Tax=Rhodococcus sp. IEGM 1409 TaxID=3047082 RepID=UPI0024B81B6B|nr:SDR family NAD(P)-dependent oxidoreductase [Rhodococcus sp. IEGM 1409]MDI9900487.1 SDR family NAD(P)-dependent oxidoreductase [Rhodococcus sp. IEGM 1409]
MVADIENAGGTAVARLADVTDAADMQSLADFTVDAYGRIDVLVNNAGLMLFSYRKDLALDDWNRMLDVNIRGYLTGVHAVLPVMLRQKSGHILNMDSVAGHQVGAGAGVYSATKFFVQAMTESMRKELSVHAGIKASTISPGVIDTGWADQVTDPAGRQAAQELNAMAIAPSPSPTPSSTHSINPPTSQSTTWSSPPPARTGRNWALIRACVANGLQRARHHTSRLPRPS